MGTSHVKPGNVPERFEVYARATSGKKMEKVPSSVVGGKLRFRMFIKARTRKGESRKPSTHA